MLNFILGFFISANNQLNAKYDTYAFNYLINGSGQEIFVDTVFYNPTSSGKINLPLQQGFGLGFKKGERLNIVIDYISTNWKKFKIQKQIIFTNSFRNFRC